MLNMFFQLVDVLGDSFTSVVAGAIAWAIGSIANLILVITAALPSDPFQLPEVGANWEMGLSWLNWFVPLGQMAALMGVWVAATLAYYAAQFMLHRLVDIHRM